jgi:hypothetical protein
MAQSEPEEAERNEILVRLAQSREELKALLEPPSDAQPGPDGEPAGADVFPRSRTMRALLGGPGLKTVAMLIGGLLVARPALAWRLIRMLPASAVTRTLLVKAFTALRATRHPAER